MEDILDFLKTPAGQGILSGAFGYAANARKGQPWNSFGRGGMTGLLGYNTAIDQQQQQEGIDLAKSYKTMQMDQMKMAMDQKARDDALMSGISASLESMLSPQTLDKRVGYSFNPQRDSANVRFDTSNPNAETDYAKAATFLAQKVEKGQQLTPDEQMIFDQFKNRFSPVTEKVQVQPNLEKGLRNLAVQLMPFKPEMAKGFLTAAPQYAPKEWKAGSYYGDSPDTAQYLGNPEKGITVVNGKVVQMPGAAEALSNLTSMVEGAKAGAVKKAEAPYETPVVLQGAGPGGSNVIVPRDRVPELGRNGAIPTMSPTDQSYSGERAKDSAATMKDIQTAGLQAPGKIAKYQELGRLLDGFEGGSLSGTGLQLAKLGNSIGIQIDPKLPNKEAAATLTNQLALSLRSTANGEGMPGALSDADRQFLMSSVPNLGQSAEGRRTMVQMQTAIHQREIAVSEMARKWESKYGRLNAPNPNGETFFDGLSKWSQSNPLFGGK